MQLGHTPALRLLLIALAASTALTSTALQSRSRADEVSNTVNNFPPVTKTPIQHLVVIYQENETFDHYCGTYPNALNDIKGRKFTALENTPGVNGLSPALLTNNPNKSTTGAQANPQRLAGPAEAITCSQNHNYTPEQQAVDAGLMDKFQASTGRTTSNGCANDGSTVMNYFDGNTVTALWNYAQHFAMSDNAFGTNF